MAKKGYVGKSLEGLRSLTEAITAIKGGRVDVGFFAGKDQRTPESSKSAAARAKRTGKFVGAGSKPGFYKQGIQFAKRRAQVAGLNADEGLTNSEIAAKHEFGIGVPRRSMLRMPLHLHGDQVLKKGQADARVQLAQMQKNPTAAAKKVLERVGIAAENVVQDAFDTQGFGSWKPNSPVTVALKGSDAPLIDSAQMRHAVDSRAVI